MPSINGRATTRRELMRRVGRLDQIAGVRLVTLGDGIERGVRVLEFRTGTGYAFEVLVDRSMDVGRCELNGRALAWLSPTGVVGPWFTEPMGVGGLKCGAHVVLREFACVASPRGRRDAAEARVLVPLALNLCAGSVHLPTVSADGSRINVATPRLLP